VASLTVYAEPTAESGRERYTSNDIPQE